MWKWKFFIDFEKEEKWLQEMARQGLELEKATFGYTFRHTSPEDTIIRIDYRTFKKEDDFVDYCTLFEDSGWKHIAGKKSSGTQYFKKVNENGNDDIFSDKQSKAGKYKRLSEYFFQFALAYFPILFIFLMIDIIDFKALINPKLLYYTPGLWELSGKSFWFAFLFETPFALMRGFLWLIIPLMIVLFIIYGYKARKLYQREMMGN